MAFTEIDEKVLVRAYQAGDERAFDTIVRTQYNALYAHALRRLSQHEAAEDAVQDTLLRAYRALPNLDGDLALRAWLHRILTNVCHDEGNRRRRQQGLVDKVSALPDDLADDPADEAVLYETVRVMSEALAELPESYREALVLRYVDGLSFREVAEITGVTEENARARVHRGRNALNKIMARLAVMLAFIIPGLRRTQTSAPASPEQAVGAGGISDHAVNLTTQLTTHVMTSAPAVSRVAEAASSLPSGTKSALAAAAVTAVAAVSVPVAVHTVREVQRTERPAPVAAPTTSSTIVGPSAAGKTDGAERTDTISTSSTSSSLPPSQLFPFAPTAEQTGATVTTTPAKESTTTTTASPSTPSGSIVEGKVSAADLTIAGAAPQWDVSGPMSLVVNGKTNKGSIAGRVYTYDDGTAESDELVVTIRDTELVLRFRGRVVKTETTDSHVTQRIDGNYVFHGASAFGLPERGTVIVTFSRATSPDVSSVLDLALRGQSS
jgi:RNA polymerase sigma-70 factor (ECF subfamily)